MAKDKDQTDRTFEKKLPVQLSDDELRQKGIHLARLLDEIEDKNSEKKDIGKEVKTLKEKAAEIKKHLTSGVEERSVEVRETADWKRKRVTLTRTDTGETVEDRAMRDDEVQKPLSLTPGQGKASDEKKPIAPAKPTLIKGGKNKDSDGDGDGKDGAK